MFLMLQIRLPAVIVVIRIARQVCVNVKFVRVSLHQHCSPAYSNCLGPEANVYRGESSGRVAGATWSKLDPGM